MALVAGDCPVHGMHAPPAPWRVLYPRLRASQGFEPGAAFAVAVQPHRTQSRRSMMKPKRVLLSGLVWLCTVVPVANAGEVHVAVAANFVPVLQALAPEFEDQLGHRLVITSGSTGKLYAQIHQGAPFHVFLAADSEHPERLEQAGLAVPGSRFTYAVGRLVLLGREEVVRRGLEGLLQTGVRRIALANREISPYGRAAHQALREAGLWQAVQPRVVWGENVNQAFHYVMTGNADAGLVALSQVAASSGGELEMAHRYVPEDYYTAIVQQGVLLRRGQGHGAAQAFLHFIKGPRARDTIQRFGYR